MEGYLRYILLAIAASIVFLIFYEASRKRKQAKRSHYTGDAVADPSHTHTQAEHLEPKYRQAEFDLEPEVTYMADAPEPEVIQHDAPAEQQHDVRKDLLVLSVVAKETDEFASYDLLQAIAATGLQYGEMNIFHHYTLTPSGRVTLFSLASATEPGEFDLNRMGDFACSGLTLFTNLREVADPQEAFDQMLLTATQLAEDLEGELRAGSRVPWNDDALHHYQQKVLNYQLMKNA